MIDPLAALETSNFYQLSSKSSEKTKVLENEKLDMQAELNNVLVEA